MSTDSMHPNDSEAIAAAKEMLASLPYLDVRCIHDGLQKRKIPVAGRVSEFLQRNPAVFTRHRNGQWMLARPSLAVEFRSGSPRTGDPARNEGPRLADAPSIFAENARSIRMRPARSIKFVAEISFSFPK